MQEQRQTCSFCWLPDHQNGLDTMTATASSYVCSNTDRLHIHTHTALSEGLVIQRFMVHKVCLYRNIWNMSILAEVIHWDSMCT